MVDLTPQPVEPKKQAEGLDFLDKAIDNFVRNVQENPEVQAKLYDYAVNEQGIDPNLLGAILPINMDETNRENGAKGMEDMGPNLAGSDTEGMSDTPPAPDIVTAESVISVLEGAIDTLPMGENMTLGQVLKFAKSNPDLIENLIESEL